MAVVPAFTSIVGTDQAGMTAYYRAPGCNSVTIADVLPLLSKINHYEPEYVIGELLIWDNPDYLYEPNNCTKVRVIVYNDGWICAWFDKTTTNQIGASGLTYVDSTTVSGYGSSIQYPNELNGMVFEITNNGGDPDTLVGAKSTIRNTDNVTGEIQLHTNAGITFHNGYTYSADIYMSNGNMIWYGITSRQYGHPPTNANRLYQALLIVWNEIRFSSNSANWSPIDAFLVYRYDSQLDTYSDETTDFNDSGLDDCQVLPSNEVINDAFYIGYSYKFNGVTLTINTPGVGSGVTWEYWNGSTWTTLSCVDGSVGFTMGGELTFNPPDSWSKTFVSGNNYFWIRARVTTAQYTITPILTQGRLYNQDSIEYTETQLGIYNYEFTNANYVLLMGDYGRHLYSHWYNYFTILPGKTIYDSIFNVGVSYHTVWETFYVNGHSIFTDISPTNGLLVCDISNEIPNVGIQCVIDAYTHTYEYLMSCVIICS